MSEKVLGFSNCEMVKCCKKCKNTKRKLIEYNNNLFCCECLFEQIDLKQGGLK